MFSSTIRERIGRPKMGKLTDKDIDSLIGKAKSEL